jgi:hypothetical protein
MVPLLIEELLQRLVAFLPRVVSPLQFGQVGLDVCLYCFFVLLPRPATLFSVFLQGLLQFRASSFHRFLSESGQGGDPCVCGLVLADYPL